MRESIGRDYDRSIVFIAGAGERRDQWLRIEHDGVYVHGRRVTDDLEIVEAMRGWCGAMQQYWSDALEAVTRERDELIALLDRGMKLVDDSCVATAEELRAALDVVRSALCEIADGNRDFGGLTPFMAAKAARTALAKLPPQHAIAVDGKTASEAHCATCARCQAYRGMADDEARRHALRAERAEAALEGAREALENAAYCLERLDGTSTGYAIFERVRDAIEDLPPRPAAPVVALKGGGRRWRMNIVKTGVFATKEEIAQAIAWSSECREVPCIKVKGTWLNVEAEEEFKRRIDALAAKHGLPALGLRDGEQDHYGMSGAGEFTTLGPEEP